MIICEKCGAEYEDSATYCNVCKTDLNNHLADHSDLNKETFKKPPKNTLINIFLLLLPIWGPILIVFMGNNDAYKNPDVLGLVTIFLIPILPLIGANPIYTADNLKRSEKIILFFLYYFLVLALSFGVSWKSIFIWFWHGL